MEFKYELKNFKAFKSTGPISIKPLTLIFGSNSAGKSSLVQPLLLLAQTLADRPDPSACFLAKGIFVDLGNYREFINEHKVSKPFAIRFDFKSHKAPRVKTEKEIEKYIDEFFKSPIALEFEFGYAKKETYLSSIRLFHEEHDIPLVSFELDASKDEKGLIRGASLDGRHPSSFKMMEASLNLAIRHGKAKSSVVNDEAVRRYRTSLSSQHKRVAVALQNFIPIFLLSEYRKKTTPVAPLFGGAATYVQHYRSNKEHLPNLAYAVLAQTCSYIQRFVLDSLDYLGPLREQPRRFYVYSGNVPNRIGADGGATAEHIYKNDNELIKRLNRRIKRFGLNYVLEKPKSGDSEIFDLRLRDSRTGTVSSIADVGFGVSQVLPILVQSTISKNRVICIEQPEIHLHPAMQSELGDIFIEGIGGGRKNTFILETHSEHLILRLLRRIREGKLSKDDLSVLFVDTTAEGSKILQLEVDDDGDFIDEWPGGFFEESYRETMSGR